MKPHASDDTVERLIVGKVVEGMLDSVPMISAETGDQEPLIKNSDDVGKILAAVFAAPDYEVWLFTPHRKSWVKLVIGNGCAVISDYTLKLEAPLAKANALAKALEA